MAIKPSPSPAEDLLPPLDMDSLLSLENKIPETNEPAEPAETAADARIRELTAELSTPSPAPLPERFRPTSELSDQERQIRDLEDQVARKRSREAEDTPVQYDRLSPEGGERILLHFLEDGLTFGGMVWYRGQEVEFVVGSEAHNQQKDRLGNSWLDLVDDAAGQYRRWGKRMFASGSWPGASWEDTSTLTDPAEISRVKAAATAERRRGRAAPLI